MVRIAFVLADGFEDQEFASPHTTLAEEGHRVEIVAREPDEVLTGMRGQDRVDADVGIADVVLEDYAGSGDRLVRRPGRPVGS